MTETQSGKLEEAEETGQEIEEDPEVDHETGEDHTAEVGLGAMIEEIAEDMMTEKTEEAGPEVMTEEEEDPHQDPDQILATNSTSFVKTFTS